jgi:uncharacterized RDD family membrane protein YckC
MRPNVRRGAIAGLVMSGVFASISAGSSSTPIEAFVVTLGVTLTATVAVVALMAAASTPPVTPAGQIVLGGFWIRAAAFALDWIPFVLVGLVLAPLGAAVEAGLLVVGFAYFVGLWRATGQTLGMRAIGLRVVREDGGAIGWGDAVLRFCGLLAAFLCLYLGVIWVAFDPRKRGWADLVGGTLVVRTS